MGIEFRLLGPLEVLRDGQALRLGGTKQRIVLAALLIHANQVVSVDALLDVLWGDDAPETAFNTIQVYVSHLRKVLGVGADGGSILLTRKPGYLLRVESGALDASRFEALADRGREELASEPATAARTLKAALTLWRGPPLGDFAYDVFAQREIARLDELRIATTEDRIEAELMLGRHMVVVGELRALSQEHPLRERLRGQLMLALYRSGRQAEALEVYRHTREALGTELGIDPSPALQRLERAILTQDSSLEVAVHVEPAASSPVGEETAAGGQETHAGTTPVPGSRATLIGRNRELDELLGGLNDAARGDGRLFLVVGEPGIGKTRIAGELTSQARARGARTLWGNCYEGQGAPAYWPWLQILRSYVGDRDTAALEREMGSGAADIAQLIPELRDHLPGLPDPPALEADAARFRLFDSITTFLRNASRAQPLALVLDDLHWADTPSLLLLEFLTRELHDVHLLVVATYRDMERGRRHPLVQTLGELARLAATRRIVLRGLTPDDVASFIRSAAAVQPPDTLVSAVHRRSEGNPFFMGEIVRLLISEGHLDGSQLGELQGLVIPQGVREAIGRRLAHLSDGAIAVLGTAAVIGREFDLTLLVRAADLSGESVLERLDEAVGARILVELGAAGSFSFSHALIREVLYDELPAARRVQAHRSVGRALEELHASSIDPFLPELAHHFFQAAGLGEATAATAYARRAGDRAMSQLAYEEGARLYQQAIDALDLAGRPDDGGRCDLFLRLGDSHWRSGDVAAARATFLEAAEAARRLRDGERLAQAALGYSELWIEIGIVDEPRVPLLEEALGSLKEQDSAIRARVLGHLAMFTVPPELRASLSREAVDMARRVDDPATLAQALVARRHAVWGPQHLEERLAASNEALELAEAVGDRELALRARGLRFRDVLEMGDVETLDRELPGFAEAAEELRQPFLLYVVAMLRVMRALLEGRFSEVEQLAQQVFTWAQHMDRQAAVQTGWSQLYAVHWEQGRLDELRTTVAAMAERYPAVRGWGAGLALIYREAGLRDEARREFDRLAAARFADISLDPNWLITMAILSEVCAFLGDSERASDLYALLVPHAGHCVVVGNASPVACLGSVSGFLGLLATTTGRFDAAKRHFEEGLAMNRNMGAWPWAVRTEHAYARMLIARASPGDEQRASELLDRAIEGARRLGMTSVLERVQDDRARLAGAPDLRMEAAEPSGAIDG